MQMQAAIYYENRSARDLGRASHRSSDSNSCPKRDDITVESHPFWPPARRSREGALVSDGSMRKLGSSPSLYMCPAAHVSHEITGPVPDARL